MFLSVTHIMSCLYIGITDGFFVVANICYTFVGTTSVMSCLTFSVTDEIFSQMYALEKLSKGSHQGLVCF